MPQSVGRSHLGRVSGGLSLRGPVGALLLEDQVLLGQLQGELGHLELCPVELGEGVTLPGAQLLQLPAQTLSRTFRRVQTLLEAAHLQQSGLVLLLKTAGRGVMDQR